MTDRCYALWPLPLAVALVPVFAIVLLVVRGWPSILAAPPGASRRDRAATAFFGATGLPIIVAVTEVALSSDLMKPATASLLVGAGALTVLAFPFAAQILDRSTPAPLPR